MAELITIARPYAEAVFRLADSSSERARWSEMLQLAATVALDDDMRSLLNNARYTREQVLTLFLNVCGDKLDTQGKNLVKLLSENGRLTLLPEIAVVYEALRANEEGTIEAEMISAYPVSDAQRSKIAAALAKRLGREVNLKVTEDKSLLGGAIIRAGDMVIDGSVQGKLEKLASNMNQ